MGGCAALCRATPRLPAAYWSHPVVRTLEKDNIDSERKALFVWWAARDVREPPDMMSASEEGGGHGKADVVRGVA